MKAGLFTDVDPGVWHPRYALRPLALASPA
jgi:hypothetical protein